MILSIQNKNRQFMKYLLNTVNRRKGSNKFCERNDLKQYLTSVSEIVAKWVSSSKTLTPHMYTIRGDVCISAARYLEATTVIHVSACFIFGPLTCSWVILWSLNGECSYWSVHFICVFGMVSIMSWLVRCYVMWLFGCIYIQLNAIQYHQGHRAESWPHDDCERKSSATTLFP